MRAQAPPRTHSRPCQNPALSGFSKTLTQNASTPSARKSPTSQRAPKRFGGIFDYDAKSERLRTVNAALEDPAVWNEPKKAQELGKEKKQLEGIVVTLGDLARELSDNLELFEMSKYEGDDDGLATIETDTQRLARQVEALDFRRMFINPADPLNCF